MRSRWWPGLLAMWLVSVLVAGAGTTSPLRPVSQVVDSGLLLSGFDRQMRAQDDLFRFVNGSWLRSTEIPPDKTGDGHFFVLKDRVERDLRMILEDSAASHAVAGSPEQKIGDFYTSFMDTAQLDALGATPLRAPLSRIEALSSSVELTRYLGESATSSLPGPVWLFLTYDPQNASAYIPGVQPAGLTMPEKVYVKSDQRFVAMREKFRSYAARVLGLAGVADPQDAAAHVVTVESQLAQIQLSATKKRDRDATDHKFTVAEASARTPGLDWKTYLSAARVSPREFVIGKPGYFSALGETLNTIELAKWKAYLKFQLIDHFAPALSAEFATAHFEFHGRDLKGQEKIQPRWEWGVAIVQAAVSDLVSQRYVQRRFPPEVKTRIKAMADRVIEAYRRSIDGMDWMSEETKVQARDKLSKITVKIGYPNQWRNYSALVVTRDDLVGNIVRAAQLNYQQNLAKLSKPVDRNEWSQAPEQPYTPQTVDAHYYRMRNDITIPAGILQPPFFDPRVDDAVNYGAIGMLIGHEIGHAFDSNNRRYDGAGNLRNWWAPQDAKRFDDKADALDDQYSAYQPLPGEHIDGEQTLAENLADLSGATVAFRAYRLSLGGRAAPVMDGFTGEQRFFLGYAQAWREKLRDRTLLYQLSNDVHSPKEFRINGVVTNLPEFYTAFNVKKGDRLYRPPNERIKIF